MTLPGILIARACRLTRSIHPPLAGKHAAPAFPLGPYCSPWKYRRGQSESEMDLGDAIFILTALLTSTALLTGVTALSLSFLHWKEHGVKLGQGDGTLHLKKAKPLGPSLLNRLRNRFRRTLKPSEIARLEQRSLHAFSPYCTGNPPRNIPAPPAAPSKKASRG